MVIKIAKLAVVIGLLSQATCKTTTTSNASLSASPISANEEFYGDRPDIQKITPKKHKNLDANWEQMKEGFLESVAMWNGLMPEYDKYYLARDLENLYDISRILEPKSKRHHLINVSTSLSSDPLLKDYMADNGVTEESLKGGQKILLLDTGFAGSVPDGIKDEFSAAARKNMKGQLLSCSSGRYPSTYLFLAAINPTISYLTTDGINGNTIAGEVEDLTKFTDSADQFQKNSKGKYDATSYKNSKYDKAKAKKHMQDLAAFAKTPAAKKLYKERVAFWKALRKLNDKGDKASIISFFKKKIAAEKSIKGKNFVQSAYLDYMDTIKFSNLKGPKLTLKDFDLELYIPKGYDIDPYDIDIPDLIEDAAKEKKWEKVKMLVRIGESANQLSEIVEAISDALPKNASNVVRQQFIDSLTYIIARDFRNNGADVVNTLAYQNSELLPDVAKYLIEQSVVLGTPEIVSEVMDHVSELEGKDAEVISDTILKEFFEQKRPKKISSKYWDEIGESSLRMILEVSENEEIANSRHLKQIIEISMKENRFAIIQELSDSMDREALSKDVDVLALILRELSKKPAAMQKKYIQIFKKGSATDANEGPGALFGKVLVEAAKLKDLKKVKQKFESTALALEKLTPVKFDGKAVEFIFDFSAKSLGVGNRFATLKRQAFRIVAIKKQANSNGLIYEMENPKGIKFNMITNYAGSKDFDALVKAQASLEKSGVAIAKPVDSDASYQIYKARPQNSSMTDWLDKEWKSSVLPKTAKAQKASEFFGQLVAAGVNVANIRPANIVWIKGIWVYYGASDAEAEIPQANKATEARIRTRWGKFVSAFGKNTGTACKLLEALAGQSL